MYADVAKEIEVTVRSGGYEVIASGTAQTFGSNGLELSIAGLLVELTFSTDRGSPRIETGTDTRRVRLNLINFESTQKAGTVQPIEIGKLDGQPLFLSLAVTGLGSPASRVVNYTFYIPPAGRGIA